MACVQTSDKGTRRQPGEGNPLDGLAVDVTERAQPTLQVPRQVGGHHGAGLATGAVVGRLDSLPVADEERRQQGDGHG